MWIKSVRLDKNWRQSSGNPRVKNCTTCSYIKNDDSTVSGKTTCNYGERSTPEILLECPLHQSTSYFIASASYQVGVYETYKALHWKDCTSKTVAYLFVLYWAKAQRFVVFARLTFNFSVRVFTISDSLSHKKKSRKLASLFLLIVIN